MQLRRATVTDVDAIAPLFDRYRQFYEQAPDPAKAHDFIQARLSAEESVIFIAENQGQVLGFTQLFPSFSSVGAARAWILNDLYVLPEARRQGVARALLGAAADFGRATGAARLELETDHDNRSAQALYRHLGWEVYDSTMRFRLRLDPA
ncbi:GNAT family N-acetyltransferase [Pseudoxanthomonas indica]|uniref:L-amino acid N-acyltransferase YncA n=1 Tax=Pseudoxanthomonas indica TaxID=428993 RepID=A0A1T5JLZ1_9GAMM|nr:GNAT family N-acetyltransferase [Pseudoxanthomonas indica]GGD43216.1 putative N-acetyltransferase YhfO [Pseudoxanthomonas indica]SKC52597.1 L-amino acid N-acyltransferase YncA [Pseudoxanthomonas indica]